ncbi:putative RNA polymerase II transcription factor SIII subunit A [Rosellinia necatrix]|uniref:Putative RNA polymerase II transcription factor SIII subunit A n=1 Tax=Rosellinia necatrix TaxID=77044 RepID=A0A1S7UK35_ROSNE|nr:putative RNA polymerase II transcription factor SIII subunit A [Rosellinia necatrix]
MVKSLVELCTAVCLRNIKDIDDMGDIPFELVRPIILRIDNPAQLRRVEVNSPHLEEHTPECWRRLIARDFPVLAERYRYVPSNPRSWHKIYAKYRRSDADARRAAMEKLQNAYKEIKKEKDQTPQVGVRRPGRGGPDQSELRFTGGSRTKTNTPKSLLKRAIREAKEISTRNRLNTSANAGRVRPGQVLRAPTGMVQEKINNARPAIGIRPPAPRTLSNSRNREIEDREARLQRAKRMNSQKGGSYLEDDDLDDLDIDDDGPAGLDIDDLEASTSRREPEFKPKSKPPESGGGPPRGSAFARKMGNLSTIPSTSRVYTETRPKQSSPTTSSAQSRGPASPPLKPLPTPSSTSPGSGPMLPRKRKAVDVFMKPKPKLPRR